MFYLIAIVSFLIVPISVSLLIVSPFLFPSHAFWYFSLKPYGLQIFEDKQTLWNFLGIFSAGIGVILGLLYKDRNDEQIFINTVHALKLEIMRNIDLIFSGEVERPFVFLAFDKINNQYSSRIRAEEKYAQIRQIYDELAYYREIVKIFRLNNPGDIVTERQFNACKLIVKYFYGEKQLRVKNFNGVDKWQRKRSELVRIKKKEIGEWGRKLEADVKEIFC